MEESEESAESEDSAPEFSQMKHLLKELPGEHLRTVEGDGEDIRTI